MKQSKLLASGLFTLLLACAEDNHRHSHGSRGNEALQSALSMGAGAFRSPSPKASTSLSLTERSDIVSVKVDPASGVWANASFDTRHSQQYPAASDLKAIAKEYIKNHEAELGLSAEETVENHGNVMDAGPDLQMVVFERKVKGLPVKGAFIQIFFAKQKDGSLRLSEIVNNSYGAIALAADPISSPSNSEALVVSGLDELTVQSSQMMIQPSIGIDGRYEFSYATEYKISDEDSGEVYTVTLNNADLQITEAYSNHVYEQQQIFAETFVRSYVLKDQAIRPLQFATVIDGANRLVTDANGFVDLQGKNVTIQLVSDKSAGGINNGDTPDFFTFPATIGANGRTDLRLNATDLASINTFVAMQEVSNFVGRFLTPQQFVLLAQGIRARTNLAETCNAFYNGQSLNFFREGNGCANTALVSDIVYHEWGHAMDDYLGSRNRTKGQSGISDSAFSEGIGDILSAYMVRSPNLAPGFFLNSNRALRTLQNQRLHPPANAQEAEVHSAGLIIGGAFWDLFDGLSQLYGGDEGQIAASNLFLKHLLVTDRYIDSYQSVLRVDDSDNNAATQSPHKCLITKAFARHNLSGGDSVAADCVDTDTSLRVRIDLDQGEGKLSLLVAAAGAKKIVACEGAVKNCATGAAGFVEFGAAAEGNLTVAKGSRNFFEARGTIQTRDDALFTIVSQDANGKVLGVKTLAFKPRDRTDESASPEAAAP